MHEPKMEKDEARTSRLVLRRLRLDDVADVHLIRARPEAMVYTYAITHQSPTHAADMAP